jgi:hypothetical protein
MIAIQWNPSRKQLRQFAGIWFPAFCFLAGWMVGKKTGHWDGVQLAWAVCGAQALLGMIYPPGIRLVFVGLILMTFPIGWVASHVLLGAIFYLVVTPIGLILKISGHDLLQLEKPSGNSTWMNPVVKTDATHYLRQS